MSKYTNGWKDIDIVKPNDGQECLVRRPFIAGNEEMFDYRVMTYWEPNESNTVIYSTVWQDPETEINWYSWNWPQWIGIDELENIVPYASEIDDEDNEDNEDEEES